MKMIQMKSVVMAVVMSVSVMACKARQTGSSVKVGDGDGAACPRLDVVKVSKEDRAKAIRLMAFHYRMMLRGNTRATTFYLAAVEGVTLEQYVAALDAAQRKGSLGSGNKPLLTASAGDIDAKMDAAVEAEIMKSLLTRTQAGETVKISPNSRGLNLATMAARFGEVSREAIAANPELRAEVAASFEEMIKTVFEVETGEVEQTNARIRSRVLLDQIADASRQAGFEQTTVDEATGSTKRTSIISDLVFTNAYIKAMGTLAETALSGSTQTAAARFDFFAKDFVELARDEKILEGTGVRELAELLKRRGTPEFERLRTTGKFTVGGDSEFTLDKITNPDALIERMKAAGGGKSERLLDAMRARYSSGKERTR